ncbi:MAG: hypothetical protein R6X25_02625 [Candidatus Krumholzibacteriia bacterium]
MRHLLHGLASAAMWGVFVYYWIIVLGREIGPSTVRSLAILGVIIVLGLVVTLFWVRHNLRLAARLNRRRDAPPAPPEVLERDTLGRPVNAPPLAELRYAPVVDISVADDGSKLYIPVEEAAALAPALPPGVR